MKCLFFAWFSPIHGSAPPALLNSCSHYAKIQDLDSDFYSQFHIVVCGLDSIVARRWINGMLVSLLVYDDGVLDQSRYSKH